MPSRPTEPNPQLPASRQLVAEADVCLVLFGGVGARHLVDEPGSPPLARAGLEVDRLRVAIVGIREPARDLHAECDARPMDPRVRIEKAQVSVVDLSHELTGPRT